MNESYTMPLERKRWELFSLNVPKPWHAPLESKDIQCMVDKAKQNQSPITCKKKKIYGLFLNLFVFSQALVLAKARLSKFHGCTTLNINSTVVKNQ